jgi:hypothetical protein
MNLILYVSGCEDIMAEGKQSTGLQKVLQVMDNGQWHLEYTKVLCRPC